ncbi:MAG TPA: SDR family NAD(P)-dependent oxidoreductase [Thermoanaerobaculia bacterium]|nr:SDR family NAD(P)-dependent oxidoreductase [Thermoanaerobaculia bacterium]
MTLRFARAIVVGASSGIGAALAVELGKEGAAVALLARREGELAATAAAVAAAGGRASTYRHDVTDSAAVPGLFERIEAELGGVDLVVYAAGVMPEVVEGEYDFGKDRQMIEVNLLGAMAWFDLAAARFEAKRAGTLVGISSIAGERGRRGAPGYGTSKAAFTAYLEALRNRVSRYGVNVVTVKPGFVDTAMTRGKPGLFWVVSPQAAAARTLALARRGTSASAFVPARWALVALVVRSIPSFLFRRLNV